MFTRPGKNKPKVKNEDTYWHAAQHEIAAGRQLPLLICSQILIKPFLQSAQRQSANKLQALMAAL